MDTVINKLSEIEVAASRILDGAASQKKALDQQQEERIAEYDRQMMKKLPLRSRSSARSCPSPETVS